MSEGEDKSDRSERRKVRRGAKSRGDLYQKREELLKEMQVEDGVLMFESSL